MNKKLRNAIIVSAVGVVLSTVMAVGTVVANNYASLLDVFFTQSSYSANASEKDVCRQERK